MSKISEKMSSLNHKVVYGVLVVLLLLSFGYIYYSNNKSTKIIHEKEIQYLQLSDNHWQTECQSWCQPAPPSSTISLTVPFVLA